MRSSQYQQGLSVVFALFVVIIIALLGAGLLQLNRTDSEANTSELLSLRAFMAAESALQRMMTDLYPPNLPFQVDVAACTTTATTFNTPGLVYCSASVECEQLSVASVEYFRVTSTGLCQVGNDPTQVAQRQIRIEARCENGPPPNC